MTTPVMKAILALMQKAPIVYATWDPANKGAPVILSGGNLVATFTATAQSVRATILKTTASSMKPYVEVAVTSGSNVTIGLENTSASLSNFVGGDANGFGYNGGDGQKYINSVGSPYGATFTSGDVIGIAWDIAASQVTFYKNNVSQGVASVPIGGSMTIAAGTPATISSVTANFGASAMVYSPPSTYTAGLY